MSSSRRKKEPAPVAILKGTAVTCTIAAVTITYGNRCASEGVTVVVGVVLQFCAVLVRCGCAQYVRVE